MKRVYFIMLTLGAAVGSIVAGKINVFGKPTERRMTWAERIAQEIAETGGRRAEHLLHGKYCNGSLDRLYTPSEIAKRKAKCARVCGLCRYINSLAIWPQQGYCRPPEDFLDSLEAQEWCLTWQTEPPYRYSRSHKSTLSKRSARRR